LILNISGDEDEILKQMHHKTRYNIRLSARKGVKVRVGDATKDLDSFYSLMQKTTRRDNFKPHSKKYYHNQLKTLGKENLINLLIAEKDGKPIAALIVTFYADRATYLHGAMDGKYRKLMGPHILQWEAIKLAKEKKCTQYDFWGIAPKEHDEEHAWGGITRFKEGFGGEKYYLTGSLDYIYQSFWYRIYMAMSQKTA
jgi:lipid II:glycine glycyltransferase (peptidoglycan interpeptide bridge formation enzyme)